MHVLQASRVDEPSQPALQLSRGGGIDLAGNRPVGMQDVSHLDVHFVTHHRLFDLSALHRWRVRSTEHATFLSVCPGMETERAR